MTAAFIIILTHSSEPAVPADSEAGCTLVIDAGHGGKDSGAVSIDGTKESDLNLSIALKLESMSGLLGVNTLMTRSGDCSSADMDNYSEHEDLVHRTELVNTADEPVLISIHQNCFPTSQPGGAEVLYSKCEDSKRLGNIIQNNIINSLDSDSRRLAAPAPGKLYITSNVSCPAVIVECGFMSNFEDINNLKDDSYQSALALVILSSYLQYKQAEA